MAPRPVAKGFCEYCGGFYIWDKTQIQIVMHERPNLPEVISNCPSCQMEICNMISFKDAFMFQERGVKVGHTYDEKDDVQPLTENDVDNMITHLDEILKYMVN